VNPRRYGKLTWLEEAGARFATFTPQQAEAVVAYLRFKRQSEGITQRSLMCIDQALQNYWLPRSGS
jgi:hypothetical protein